MAQRSPPALYDVLEQSPTDMYENGVDEARCIAGTVEMTWDKVDKSPFHILVVIREHKFQVFFQLHNEYLEVLQALQPRDKFWLSLRGAKLRKLKASKDPCTLPLYLLFSDGVELHWKQSDGRMQNLNTWIGHDDRIQDVENSWFMSPTDMSESKPRAPKRSHDEIESACQEGPHKNVSRERISQAEKKRRRSAARELKRANNDQYQHTSQSMSRVSDDEAGSVNVNPFSPSQKQNLSPKLTEGLRSGTTFYPPIRDVRVGAFTSLIGVVAAVSTSDLTQKGDWMRFVQIVDPSIYDSSPSGIKINCFTKHHVEWLPTAEAGDVLVLRSVKILRYLDSLVGTGYHDKLQWVACSPPGRIHHGPPNNAPQEVVIGPGNSFSPFYQPTKEEILYCVKLSDWWRGVQKEEQNHRVHTSYSTPQQRFGSSGIKRVHRLISEAGPNVPPNGYFDCTVEVLQGRPANYGGAYLLLVTDYTRNEQTGQSSEFPSLSDKVLQIQMWDAAAEIGPSMRPGDFLYITNARMITDRYSGYLQAKIQQNKMVHLKEADADQYPHLMSLLKRKRQWEEDQNLDEEPEHRLFENFELHKFLSCTVEILHAVTDSNEGAFIYVTDYTSHSLLGALKVDEPWAKLTGYILKIFLVKEQERMAESVIPGSFYSIRNLRWKLSSYNGCIHAQLGGNEKLITKLNPNNTHNEYLNGLLRRKESWERNIAVARAAESRDPACIRIKDVPPSHAGAIRFKVYAKPVSFYPMSLEDVFYQFCARCKSEIPKTRHACVECDDVEHKYVEIKYQVYLIIEDEDKEQILVSINDTSNMWDGIKRVNLQDDDGTARQLRARLSPLLGNLPLVHEYYSIGQTLPKRTSFFTFELDSWTDDRMGRAYSFLNLQSHM